jgi:hypothetical protein
VLLFDNDGTAEHAWFFSNRVAAELRRMNTKSKYIPVTALREAFGIEANGIVDICTAINGVAVGCLTAADQNDPYRQIRKET